MTFTYRVFYEDDSVFSYGKIRSRLIRARSKEKAMQRFREVYGIEPLEVR
jgi:hypothetical protein